MSDGHLANDLPDSRRYPVQYGHGIPGRPGHAIVSHALYRGAGPSVLPGSGD